MSDEIDNLDIDDDKKYVILGKYLKAYIKMCEQHRLLKVKINSLLSSYPDENLVKEIKALVKQKY